VFYNYEMGGPILRLVTADGSAAQDLPIRIEAQPFLPAWSPDGTAIAFSTVCESGVVCIAYVTPDGRPSSVNIVGAWGAAWRP
jgi:Tol biopolymer transport system component